jgi:aminocarboxymuconate-semialdehyde decarboxylase
MTYDIHAHCIPQSFRDWLIRSGHTFGLMVRETGRGPAVVFPGGVDTGPLFGSPGLTDRDLRLAEMDRMGIDVQVLAGWVDLTGYELGRDGAVEYSRAHNESLADEASAAPERFRSLGTVPVQFPDLAAMVLEDAMGRLGMQGAQLATTVGGRFLDEVEGLDELWGAAQDLGAFILIHPMRPLAGLDLSRYAMDNAVGRPAESSVALAGLILSGVLERFPALRICVVHGAGFIPYQIGRLDRSYHRAPELAGARISRPPSEYLRMIYADTVLHDPLALAHLIAVIGPERVLLGTDYPFPMGDQDPMALVHSTPGLLPGEIELITTGNGRAIFG